MEDFRTRVSNNSLTLQKLHSANDLNKDIKPCFLCQSLIQPLSYQFILFSDFELKNISILSQTPGHMKQVHKIIGIRIKQKKIKLLTAQEYSTN